MKTIVTHTCRIALGALMAFALGCLDKPASGPPKEAAQQSDSAPRIQPPFGDKEGYWHKQSGVGFLYPDGWENLGVRPGNPVTSLGLRKGQGVVEATLYWTVPDGPVNAETIGETEWSGLSSLYGNKLNRPEPIVVRGKPGFKLKISSGPLGEGGSELTGVVYVFAIKSGRDWWKVKLRATVGEKDNLAEVERLLDNYRW